MIRKINKTVIKAKKIPRPLTASWAGFIVNFCHCEMNRVLVYQKAWVLKSSPDFRMLLRG
jgi:hypothetical protein